MEDLTLDKILAIEGKPGLYRMVTQTRGGLVVSSLEDGKKATVPLTKNISLLSEIAIFTLEEELALGEVFKKIQLKENGGMASITPKAGALELEEYFFEILPNYDEDRVYPSDIKKVIKWYNLLIKIGMTEFSQPEAEPKDAEEKQG